MIFNNVTIITMDPNRRVLTHAAVVVEQDRILDVGKSKEIIEKYPEKEKINCNGNILMPGLVDNHVHTSQGMMRGLGEGKNPYTSLADWLGSVTYAYQGSYTKADGLASAALCILEMLKSGTTAFIECLFAETYGFDGVAELCEKAGIRACLGRQVMDISPETRLRMRMHDGIWEPREKCVSSAKDYFKKWNGKANGRIQVWFGCRSVTENNDLSLYDEVGEFSRENDMGITIHLSEVKEDFDFARKLGYPTLTHAVYDHGLLGPRTVMVHYTASIEEEWDLCAQTKTNICHCPGANARSAWGPAPVVALLERGVNVALGCDNTTAGLDLLRDLRIACHTARGKSKDRKAIRPETVLEMATINGAKAIGMESQIGSIEPGKKADFIIIDVDAPHLTPVWNPISTVVFNSLGSDVDTVVIDGKMVVQGKKVLTMDEESILEDVRKRYVDVARRANINLNDFLSPWPTT